LESSELYIGVEERTLQQGQRPFKQIDGQHMCSTRGLLVLLPLLLLLLLL